MRRSRACLAVALALVAGGARAEVSDEKVRMWISSALDGTPAPTDTAAKASVAKVRTSAASYAAWKKLKACRDDHMAADLDLAGAEHFLFIRAFAAEKGDQDIEALPDLYSSAKDGPVGKYLNLSDQPVTPPDDGVLRWGRSGVNAGLNDYTKATGKAPSPKSGKLNQYRLALQGYYDNYRSTTGTPHCGVTP